MIFPALLLLSSLALAEVPSAAPSAQLEAMQKLAFMTGRWEGHGWILAPGGQKANFYGGETVQTKLQGHALLVEGLFKAKLPSGEERVVHETLGVISYDPQLKQYRFSTWLARGSSGIHELRLTGERAWQWNISSERGQTGYSTSFANDEWHEIGERSQDGRTWQQFFEMRLKRVGR